MFLHVNVILNGYIFGVYFQVPNPVPRVQHPDWLQSRLLGNYGYSVVTTSFLKPLEYGFQEARY